MSDSYYAVPLLKKLNIDKSLEIRRDKLTDLDNDLNSTKSQNNKFYQKDREIKREMKDSVVFTLINSWDTTWYKVLTKQVIKNKEIKTDRSNNVYCKEIQDFKKTNYISQQPQKSTSNIK